jgi:hypothetical protein
VALGALLSSCAAAVPTFSGGRTTPESRADLGLGGAALVPVEDSEGGVVPAAFFRYGLARGLDAGLVYAGSAGKLELRYELYADDADTLRPGFLIGFAGLGGGAEDFARAGGELFGFFVMDATSLLELWVGPRVRLEAWLGDEVLVFGSAGGTIGIAAGFRSVHALIEVTVAYDFFAGDDALDRGYLSVMPAFALRFRL